MSATEKLRNVLAKVSNARRDLKNSARILEKMKAIHAEDEMRFNQTMEEYEHVMSEVNAEYVKQDGQPYV